MPLYTPIDFESIAESLGAGAALGQVFKADGSGSGAMADNVQVIQQYLTVGKSGDVDFTSIKDAVDYAISEGADVANPWAITIHAGTYVEDPMTLAPGVHLCQINPNRVDLVYVVAADEDEDLFTCTGGSISGVYATGVTNAGKACFRAATPYSLTILFGCGVFGCSNGVICENGATFIGMTFGSQLTGPGQDVGTVATVTGTGSFLGIVAGLIAVSPALLPYYASNPIQTGVACLSGAEMALSSCSFSIAYKDSTADAVFVDDGGFGMVTAAQIAGCANAIHIGSTGSDSKCVVTSAILRDNLLNEKIESSTGVIYANQTVDSLKRSVVSGGAVTGLIQYRDTQTTALEGTVAYQYPSEKTINFADFFDAAVSTGVESGGAVTVDSGLYVDVSAGRGMISRGDPYYDSYNVSWDAVESLELAASETNYVFYNSTSGDVEAATSAPGDAGIMLATVVTDGSGIRYLHKTRTLTYGLIAQLTAYLESTRKRALKSGMAVSQGTSVRKFDVGSGSYYINMDVISYAGASDATFSAFYDTNGAEEVASQTQLNITQYDSAGTLTAMSSGYFRSDTVIVTGDGRVNVVFGTAEFATSALALEESSAPTPTFMEPTSFPVAKIIVQEGTGIDTIVDIRPQPAIGGGGGGSGGVSVHSALAGLSADDHTQYLLGAGTRAMSGDLNMGTNAITNVGNVDGVDISSHASRHLPGGSDALTMGTPTGVLVAATAAEGAAATFARADHQHGIATGTPETVGTANASGSSSSVARLDHVHSHGNQLGGSLHADAVAATSAGFMTGSDKSKLDGIEAGATATPLSDTAPANVTKAAASAGVATEASRRDHKHDVTTAAPPTSAVAVDNTAAEGTATSLARSDHAHTVTAAAPSSVGVSNSAGSASTFVRSDHVHAGLTRGAGDFDTFTAKATPASADLVLIEDSAAAGAKKKVQVSSLSSAYSGYTAYAESEAQSTTTSSTYQEKLSLALPTLTAGTYRVQWYCEIRNSSGSQDCQVKIEYDNTTVLAEINQEQKDASNYTPISGFRVIAMTGASHQVDMDYSNELSGNTMYIRRARLEVVRIS